MKKTTRIAALTMAMAMAAGAVSATAIGASAQTYNPPRRVIVVEAPKTPIVDGTRLIGMPNPFAVLHTITNTRLDAAVSRISAKYGDPVLLSGNPSAVYRVIDRTTGKTIYTLRGNTYFTMPLADIIIR